MQGSGQTSKEYFNQLTILYAAMLAGQALLAAAAYYLNAGEPFSPDAEAFDRTFQTIAPLFAVGGLAASMFVYRNRLRTAREQRELPAKMAGYRAALIIRYSLLEAPSLVCLAAYLLSANWFYLGLSAILVLAFLLYQPSRDRAVKELELGAAERKLIEDPNAVIA